MTRTIVAGVVGCVIAIAVGIGGADRWLPAENQSADPATPVMAGSWAGEAQIAVNWTARRTLQVRLRLEPDGRATGTVGDAALRNGRFEHNRTAIGRALHTKTDWIVRGDLDGDVIKAESIRRDRVFLPLNWFDDHFEGSVNTSGSQFGGRDRMWLAAVHLRLDRARE